MINLEKNTNRHGLQILGRASETAGGKLEEKGHNRVTGPAENPKGSPQKEKAKNSGKAHDGPSGSGKSSLLSALLGDMRRDSGSANVPGTVAYVPQVCSILNIYILVPSL